jgi:hypothetical protein
MTCSACVPAEEKPTPMVSVLSEVVIVPTRPSSGIIFWKIAHFVLSSPFVSSNFVVGLAPPTQAL